MTPDYVSDLHAGTTGTTVRILWGANKTPFVPEAQLLAAHVAIERKDALLRQALAVLQDINSPAIDVCDEIAAITSELAK